VSRPDASVCVCAKLTRMYDCRKELLQDKEKMEQHAAKSREWVQQGMKEDAEKNKSRGAK